MNLVPLALLYLSYVSFLGADTARLNIASEIKKKWMARAFGRVKRDVNSPIEKGADASARAALIKAEDVNDTMSPWSSSQPHLRVKRYRQSTNHYPHFQSMRVGCRFGTCTVQNLAHQIHQYTDKDKDGTAPAGKMGSLGYGRRRRRAVPAWGQVLGAQGERRPGSRRALSGRQLWEELVRGSRTPTAYRRLLRAVRSS